MTAEQWDLMDSETARKIVREYFDKFHTKSFVSTARIEYRANTVFADLGKFSNRFAKWIADYQIK